MPVIHDIRLPVDIERGAKGGPEFRTTVVSLATGGEQRNQDWAAPRYSWDIGYGVQSKDDMAAVYRFFLGRRGRAYGFRFKDWFDYGAIAQLVGTTGNVLTRQLVKHYADEENAFTRVITLPVEDTLRVYVNDMETVAYTLGDGGVLTFVSDPGENVKATFEFDVPVRFDTDLLPVQMEWENAMAIPQISVVELL